MKNIIILILCALSFAVQAQSKAVKKPVKKTAIIAKNTLIADTVKLQKRIIKIDLDSILALNNTLIEETFKGDSVSTFVTYTPSIYLSPSMNDSTSFMNISLNIQVKIKKGAYRKALQERVSELDKEIEAEEKKLQEKIKRRQQLNKSN